MDEKPRWRDRTDVRLVGGLLAGVIPILLLLALVLTQRASTALTDAATLGLRSRAENAATALDSWLRDRRDDMDALGRDIAAARGRAAAAQVRDVDDVRGDYDVVAAYGADGAVVASSRPGDAPASSEGGWFAAARAGRTVLAPIERDGDALRWIVAAPLPGRGGQAAGVVAADIDATMLYRFVAGSRRGETGDGLIADGRGRVVLRASDRALPSEAAMVDEGALSERVRSEGLGSALDGRSGSVADDRASGSPLVSGYAAVPAAGWAVLTSQRRDEALAEVGDQRRLSLLIGLLGVLLIAAYAIAFARRYTRPLQVLSAAARRVAEGDLRVHVRPAGTTEVRELATSFNRMIDSVHSLVSQMTQTGASLSTAAAELAAAAEELARTTHAQSAAATETSSTMEELSRTSTGIAETVGDVSSRASDAQDVLSTADDAMRSSSERMLALTARVDEITGLLGLIDDIADQTNLLAVNATIEAARAGDAGRGFRVVADEVRRLAERSKRSSSDIARMIEATRAETGATVMAMEHTSRELTRGKELMDTVAEATEQVRLTTNQQGIATEQVVETMGSVSEAAGQTSATAQQIAESAGGLNELVGELRQAVDAAGTTH